MKTQKADDLTSLVSSLGFVFGLLHGIFSALLISWATSPQHLADSDTWSLSMKTHALQEDVEQIITYYMSCNSKKKMQFCSIVGIKWQTNSFVLINQSSI